MKAVVINKKKSTGKLVYSDVEKPSPGENDILVKIVSVSLNATDYRAMSATKLMELMNSAEY